MRTCLFTPSFLDGEDGFGNSRLMRNIRYIQHYWPLRHEMGFDNIILADNASSPEIIQQFQLGLSLPSGAYSLGSSQKHGPVMAPVNLYRFVGRLTRDPEKPHDYPYCWRAIDFIHELLGPLGYDKVITIDSDGFVLSPRLAHWFRDQKEGWQSLWCPRWNFPEGSAHVVVKEAFRLPWGRNWQSAVGECMERTLPFTGSAKQFIADRYGETNTPPTNDTEYYGQASLGMAMRYRWEDAG